MLTNPLCSTARMLRQSVSIFALAGATLPAAAQEVSVPEIVVRANLSEEQKAVQKLERIPGGTNLITSTEIESGRIANPADVLSKEAGVFAQSTSGGEALRLSIRGSGLQRSTQNYLAGISVLLDGIPLTTSTGVPWELVEPLAVNHITVLRGANAFETGALTLGGAIDYVPHTGYDAKRFEARAETGSFGYRRGQISTGQVVGPFDYYLSATAFREDGFRLQSESSSVRAVGNFGYKIAPNLDTRFYFSFAHEYFQVPNTLTWAQLKANPRQAAYAAAVNHWYKLMPASVFVANKTTLRLDDASKAEFTFAYKSFPQTGAGGPYVRWDASDVSASLRYTRNDDFNGHASTTTVAALSSVALHPTLKLEGWPGFFPPTKNQLINAVNFAGADIVLLGQNDLAVTPDLWLTSALALSDSPRTSEFIYPINNTYSKNYLNYAPRVGARYYLTPDVQLYGNVSRSVEPPTNWSIPKILFPTAQLGNLNLKAQTAWTAEGGVKGEFSAFKWDVTFYHSWVRDELLTVTLPGSTLTTTSNATSTTHQGVELSLDTLLWASDAPAGGAAPEDGVRKPLLHFAAGEPGQKLLLRQAYTWSDFHYRADPSFGRARLPSIPVHFYKSELEYQHPFGVYAGVNVETSPVSYPVDYANTYYARPYAIFGAKAGYRQSASANTPYQWEAYVEGRNLGNVKYAAVVSPVFNARGVDPAVFYPGEGAGIYGGVTLRY